MEILLVIVIIFIIFQFFSNRKIKKDIVNLKKRISDIESTSVETSNLGVSTEDIKSDLTADKQKEIQSEPVILDIQQESLESPLSENKTNKRKAIILFKRFEHVFIESWIALIAVVILVAGISFLGIWASTRISPESRFALIVVASAFLGGLSYL